MRTILLNANMTKEELSKEIQKAIDGAGEQQIIEKEIQKEISETLAKIFEEKIKEHPAPPKAPKPIVIRSAKDLLKVAEKDSKCTTDNNTGIETYDLIFDGCYMVCEGLAKACTMMKAAGADILFVPRKNINTRAQLEQFVKDVSEKYIFDRFNLEFYEVNRYMGNSTGINRITRKINIEEMENLHNVNLNVFKCQKLFT